MLSCLPAPLPSPRNLQEVQVPIVSNSECGQIYADPISDYILCAGGEGKGICVSLQNTRKQIITGQGAGMSQTRFQIVYQLKVSCHLSSGHNDGNSSSLCKYWGFFFSFDSKLRSNNIITMYMWQWTVMSLCLHLIRCCLAKGISLWPSGLHTLPLPWSVAFKDPGPPRLAMSLAMVMS